MHPDKAVFLDCFPRIQNRAMAGDGMGKLRLTSPEPGNVESIRTFIEDEYESLWKEAQYRDKDQPDYEFRDDHPFLKGRAIGNTLQADLGTVNTQRRVSPAPRADSSDLPLHIRRPRG